MAVGELLKFRNRISRLERAVFCGGLPSWAFDEAQQSVARQLREERNYVRPADYPFKSEPARLSELTGPELEAEIERRAEECARYPDQAAWLESERKRRAAIEAFLQALDETEPKEDEYDLEPECDQA